MIKILSLAEIWTQPPRMQRKWVVLCVLCALPFPEVIYISVLRIIYSGWYLPSVCLRALEAGGTCIHSSVIAFTFLCSIREHAKTSCLRRNDDRHYINIHLISLPLRSFGDGFFLSFLYSLHPQILKRICGEFFITLLRLHSVFPERISKRSFGIYVFIGFL
jgi:hypothetical protein